MFCFVFYNFGMARVASQRVFSEKDICVCCFDRIVIFPHFVESKKTCTEISRRWVKKSARELRSETIRAFLDNVGTKTTSA